MICVLFAVISGCHVGGFLELPGKIGKIIVSTFCGNLRDTFVCFRQKYLCTVDAQKDRISDQRVTGFILEHMSNVVFVQK